MSTVPRDASNNNLFNLGDNQNFTEACFYAERGYSVYPLDDTHSVSNATADIESLAEIWRSNPNAKCVLPLGAGFGLVAIKFDDNFIDALRQAGITEQRQSDEIWFEALNGIREEPDWLDNWRVRIKDDNERNAFGDPVWPTYLLFRTPKMKSRLQHSSLDMPKQIVIEDNHSQQWANLDDTFDESMQTLELSQPRPLPDKLLQLLVSNSSTALPKEERERNAGLNSLRKLLKIPTLSRVIKRKQTDF